MRCSRSCSLPLSFLFLSLSPRSISSRLVSSPCPSSSLLGSRASRVISRPCFSFYLLLPSSTSGLDSPVTHSQSVPRSEKALRAPPFIVRVFAGPPINRLAARCPRPLSSPLPRFLARHSSSRHRVQGRPTNQTKPKPKNSSFVFLSPLPSLFIARRSIHSSVDRIRFSANPTASNHHHHHHYSTNV